MTLMDDAELYRAQASALRQQAAKATTEAEKQQLLRVAEYWEKEAASAAAPKSPTDTK